MKTCARLGCAGLALAALIGCEADTGLIVAVSGQTVEELEFQVALSRDNLFVLDPSISGDRRSVSGRDLTAQPYELLLREDRSVEAAAPPTVRVLVLGYLGGKATSFAVLEPPQLMLRGELLRRTLVLQAVSSSATASSTGKGCYSVLTGGKTYLLVAATDHDCDGYTTVDSSADCNDADASVNPAAKEICDGKDNNCDGQYAPPAEDCYAKDTLGVCRKGKRTCTEGPTGGGLGTTCDSAGDGAAEANALYCLVYEGCFKQSAPTACLSSHLPSFTYSCTLEVVGKSCAASRDLAPPFSGTGCTWTLVDAAGLPVTVEPPTTGCTGKLKVASGAAITAGNVRLEYQDPANKRGAFVNFLITPKPVTACSSQPLSCTKK